jgi:hypothetical protein
MFQAYLYPVTGRYTVYVQNLLRIVLKRGFLKITSAYLRIIIMCKTYCGYLSLLKAYLDERNKFLT